MQSSYLNKKERLPKLEGKFSRGGIRPIKQTFLNDKLPKEGQGQHEVKLIDTPEYQALIERVFEYLKQGFTSNEILHTLMLEDEAMSEQRFVKLLKYAYQYAENVLHKDREYTFRLHMHRYEMMYRDCLEMLDSWKKPLDPIKDRWLIIKRYQAAMKALKSKEELLGLHDKSMVLEFNDTQATVVQQETLRGGGATPIAGHDLTKLSTEELVELSDLIKKIRTIPIEGVQRVLVKQSKLVIDINGERSVEHTQTIINQVSNVKIQYEDMPANVVDKFTNTMNIEEEPVFSEANVVDDVPKHIRKLPRKSELNLKEQLRQKVLEKFKDRLKE